MIKPKYFLYARKSTEEDNRQVMSIEAQLFELREFARRENLEIRAEFQESKSAKTPGREVFGEMMTRIEAGEVSGILAWHPDRLARNSIDGGRVIYAVDQKNIESLRFPTFWFEPTPQGLFMLQVAFGQSKYYSDNLVQNVKRGIRQKLRRGEWLNRAPFGYVNNPRTRNIEPHPTHARVVKKAFAEYATGRHSLVSLSQFLADVGVVTRHGTPLAKATIKRMLSNRAYLGFVKHGDEWFDGCFEPLVSPKLFEAVQKVLLAREKPRKVRNGHNFPFANLFRCEECGSMLTAQWATGKTGLRYRYYRCTKKKGNCSQPYLREEALAEQIKERLHSISLCDRYTDWMLAEIEKEDSIQTNLSHSTLKHLANKLKDNETRMDTLVETYLDGDVPKALYLKKKDKLMRDSLSLKEQKKDVERGGNNRVEPLREWVKDTKQAAFLSSSTDFHKISSFVQKIGTNHAVRDKTARFSVPAPSHFVAKRRARLLSVAPAARRSPVLNSKEVSICAGGENRTPTPEGTRF